MRQPQHKHWTSCINMASCCSNATAHSDIRKHRHVVCLPMSSFIQAKQDIWPEIWLSVSPKPAVKAKVILLKLYIQQPKPLCPDNDYGMRLVLLDFTKPMPWSVHRTNLFKIHAVPDLDQIIFYLSLTQRHRTTLTVALHTWPLRFWRASLVNVVQAFTANKHTSLPLSITQSWSLLLVLIESWRADIKAN